MTTPPIKKQLQAISDERLAQLITVERGRSALYVETAIQGQTLTLVEDRLSALLELHSLRAPQSLDREGVDQRLYHLHVEALAEIKATVDGESRQPVRDIIYGLLAEIAALPPQPEAAKDDDPEELERVEAEVKHMLSATRPGLPPAYGGCTCACHRVPGIMHMAACCRPDPSSLDLSITKEWFERRVQAEEGVAVSAGTPETAKEVGETEAVLDGPELWEIVFGVFKGDVPEELTDEKLSQIAAAVQRVFIHPAPQSPPAPVVDEGMHTRAKEALQVLNRRKMTCAEIVSVVLGAALEGRS